MTLSEFRVSFPELRTAPDEMITAFLAKASRSCAPEIYGDQFGDAVGYLAAHLLCLSPFGKNSRLQSKEARTTYGARYEEIRYEVCVAAMVI